MPNPVACVIDPTVLAGSNNLSATGSLVDSIRKETQGQSNCSTQAAVSIDCDSSELMAIKFTCLQAGGIFIYSYQCLNLRERSRRQSCFLLYSLPNRSYQDLFTRQNVAAIFSDQILQNAD